MKNVIILISFSFLISCQQQVKEVKVSKRIGYDVSDQSGKKIDLYGGAESALRAGKLILRLIMKGIWKRFQN